MTGVLQTGRRPHRASRPGGIDGFALAILRNARDWRRSSRRLRRAHVPSWAQSAHTHTHAHTFTNWVNKPHSGSQAQFPPLAMLRRPFRSVRLVCAQEAASAAANIERKHASSDRRHAHTEGSPQVLRRVAPTDNAAS